MQQPSLAPRPRLRVLQGRPPKPYSQLPLGTDDENRLAWSLRHQWRASGPFPNWYLPAKHERLGDDLTRRWLREYKARFPSDWKRMLRNTRHAGLDAAGGQGTPLGPRRRYAVWGRRTARDKSYRED
jgi:hypothetical protein